MFSPMSTPLSVEDLQRLMASSLSTLLLIDCRPFMAFNAGHIRSAHNIHCPPIVKRRSAGSLLLDNIIRCPKTRAKLLSGAYRTVVVYDEVTTDLTGLVKDSNLYLVMKTLREVTRPHELNFLEGGYEKFEIQCPHLCSNRTSNSGESFLPPLCSAQGERHDVNTLSSSAASSWHHQHHNQTHVSSSLSATSAAVPSWSTAKYSPTRDQGDPVKILPWLYIGNQFHASQPQRLRELGMTALLNVSRCLESVPLATEYFSYKCIPVEDNSTAEISCWFPEAIEYIESFKKKGETVLVHCQAGVSRSATICLAYLMYHKQCSLDHAYDYLKAKRTEIGPNLNFMRQLLEFETQLTLSADRDAYPQCRVEVCEPEPCATPLKASISLPTDLFAHSELGGLDLSACGSPLRPSLSLPLTPCTKQAVFVFESPLTPRSPAPAIAMCQSPLVSPS